MIRTLIFYSFICLLLFPNSLFAQGNYEDVVYLKNGSIIHGVIIEQVPNESIKIQTKDRNIFVFKIDEVMKITKEEIPPPGKKPAHAEEPAKKQTRKTSGYTNILEWGFSRSFSETESGYDYNGNGIPYESHFDRINNGPCLGIQDVNGYLLNPYFSAGVGIGMQAYEEMFLIPLFLDLRVNFLNTRLTPFAAVDLGHAFTRGQFFGFNTEYEDKGGFMGTFAAGVKYFPVPRMGINLSVGFRYQEVSVENDIGFNNGPPNDYTDKSLNQLNVKIGLSF